MRVVRSPYRVCPLGAHVDHQGGEVTGMALDRAVFMAFAGRGDGAVLARSRQFEGDVAFRMDECPGRPVGDWADYLRGAVRVLHERLGLARGISAVVDGHTNVGGLSSSAAVGVAYLLALEAVNGLSPTIEQNVELDRAIENDYIGLSNGILDQSIILRAAPGHLTCLDCASGAAREVPGGSEREPSIVVLFSGLRRRLAETDYNVRVRECGQAAEALLAAAGLPASGRPVLRHVPREAYAACGPSLPSLLRRRAEHFFGEQERVRRGVDLWAQGDLPGFGRLVTESGRSSVENYECGNAYLRTAFDVLKAQPGVYGARFSGAGFRGCCVAFAEAEREEEVAERALRAYLAAHPDMAGAAEVYCCRSGPGAALLSKGECG